MTEGFQAWQLHGAALRLLIEKSPIGRIELRAWGDQVRYRIEGGSAIVLPTDSCSLSWPGFAAVLAPGAYAVAPSGATVSGGDGLLIHTLDYAGLPQSGGPVEDAGRLRYIDGCSDTLLVSPAVKGEPCLNLLHLPPGIHQTEHTHPSDRIGIILRGRGTCRTPEGDHELARGMFWRIPAGGRHSFHTDGSSLDVFAWHPDSDFGPSHDDHPMLNRTIVEGVAVSDPRHQAIRTGDITV